MNNPTYLGDSVYAHYNDETAQTELMLDRHDSRPLIYVENEVAWNLCLFLIAFHKLPLKHSEEE